MDQKQYEKKLLRLHGRLNALDGTQDDRRRIAIIGQIAEIYEQLEDDAEAIAWLLKLMDLANAAGMRPTCHATAMALGRLHLENQLYEHAIRHYVTAEEMAATKTRRTAAQLSRANALSWNWRLQEAEELLLGILGRKDITAEQRVRGMTLLAGVYDNQHNGAEAQRLYTRCVEEMGNLDIFWQADILKSLAISYCNTDQFAKAVEVLHRAETLLTDHTNRHHWKMVYYALSVSYEELGKHAEALKYHKLFRETEKAISEDKVNNKLMSIQVNNRMIQVQHERELLQQRATELAEKNEIIEEERRRSEALLLNILPKDVAEELKTKGTVQARMHKDVTVLFSDFSGFTAISERLSAQELIAEIDACFRAFDQIMGKYGIEKIKTIGDAYMAVAGLPLPDAQHAEHAIRAALEMRDFMDLRRSQLPSDVPSFKIRIGLHSGPVIAGVVGTRKFAYDIWGDTVNTASRMESSGEVGKVNISGTTHALVADLFRFTPRGQVSAKGKGEMEMYFVEMPDHLT
jgi:class 3 adenylate cyclase